MTDNLPNRAGRILIVAEPRRTERCASTLPPRIVAVESTSAQVAGAIGKMQRNDNVQPALFEAGD